MQKKKIPQRKKPFPKPNVKPAKKFNYTWLMIGILSIVILIVFAPCFSAGITNWDDRRYILETSLIRALTWKNIQTMFSTKVLLSYNPLTILSYAIDYSMSGLDPKWYHVENVLLHIINTVLLFFIIVKLSTNNIVAFITSFLFALHPMHVESVAWIAGRKDVLYTLFYFIAWLFYIKHITSKKSAIYLILSITAFIFSVLSKPQAVTLPFILLATQWFMERQWKRKRILEIIPFILIAIVIGIVTLSGSLASANLYKEPLSFSEKLLYSALAFGIYVYKFFIPLDLSSIYTFTDTSSSAFLTGFLLSLTLISLLIYAVVKYYKKYPWLIFGIAFFAINIFLVLHIVATNSSLIYERFSYMAYIGICFPLATWFSQLKQAKKNVAALVLGGFGIMLCFLSNAQCRIWKSSETFWTHVIEKNPMAAEAYNNLGQYYFDAGNYSNALQNFNSSISIDSSMPDAFNNRAMVYSIQKDFGKAMVDVNKALSIQPRLAQGYNTKGNIFTDINQNDSALACYNRAIELFPGLVEARLNRGTVYGKLKQYDKALQDYAKCLEMSPNYELAYRFLGITYGQMDSLAKAEFYLRKSNDMNPASGSLKSLINVYIAKGNIAFNANKFDEAIAWYNKMLTVDNSDPDATYNLGAAYYRKGDKDKARQYWQRTLELKPGYPQAVQMLGALDK